MCSLAAHENESCIYIEMQPVLLLSQKFWSGYELLLLLLCSEALHMFPLKILQHGYDCIHVSVEDPSTWVWLYTCFCWRSPNMGMTVYMFLLKIPQHGISLSLLLQMLLLLFKLLLNFYVVILFSLFFRVGFPGFSFLLIVAILLQFESGILLTFF